MQLDPHTEARLAAFGAQHHCDPQEVLRRAVDAYLAENEAYLREKEEDATRLTHYLEHKDGVPLEAFGKWADSLPDA